MNETNQNVNDLMGFIKIPSDSTVEDYNNDDIAGYTGKLMERAGMEVIYVEHKGNKNPVGIAMTEDFDPETGEVLLWSTHWDGVPVVNPKRWKYKPEGEIVEDNGKNKIYGRKSSDCGIHVIASINGTKKHIEKNGLETGNYAIVSGVWGPEEVGDHEPLIKITNMLKDEYNIEKINHAVSFDGGHQGDGKPSIFSSEKGVYFTEVTLEGEEAVQAALEASDKLMNYSFRGQSNELPAERSTVNFGLVGETIPEKTFPNKVPSISKVRFTPDVKMKKIEKTLLNMRTKNKGLEGYTVDENKRTVTIYAEDGHGSLSHSITGSQRFSLQLIKESGYEYGDVETFLTGCDPKIELGEGRPEKIVIGIDSRYIEGSSHRGLYRSIKRRFDLTGVKNSFRKPPLTTLGVAKYPIERAFSKFAAKVIGDVSGQKIEEMSTLKCSGATCLTDVLDKICDNYILTGFGDFRKMHRKDEYVTEEELDMAVDFVERLENRLFVDKELEEINYDEVEIGRAAGAA